MLNNYINNNNNNDVVIVEIHGDKFIKFKILKKKTHQEKDIKMIRKIIILKCSLPTISILDNPL